MTTATTTVKEKINLTVGCRMCGDNHSIAVYEKDLEKWQNGTLIQEAFSYLSPSERELLISNTCNNCFKMLFGAW